MQNRHENRVQQIRAVQLLLTAVGFAITSGVAHAQPSESDRDGERRSSVVQRGLVRNSGDSQNGMPSGAARFPFDVRTIDGSANNPDNVLWGAAGVEMIRIAGNGYANGVSEPIDEGYPSVRAVSNAVNASSGSIINSRGASDYIWQWGQFLDHDITETPIAEPAEEFDIAVPLGDVWFDPFSTGVATIPLDRSAWQLSGGVRQQFNNITAFIDASNVYGSEHELADWLRTNDGSGKMKTSVGNLLPFNTDGFHNAGGSDNQALFLGGDIRANEQIALTAMHTLFVREHNYWADRVAADNPQLSGDEIYEHARAIVAAEMQAITYNEFLPLLLGRNSIPRYNGWRRDVDASIANEFATSAYRVGHTMLSPTLLRLDANGDEVAGGHVSLANAFFTPQTIVDEGIDSLLRGLAAQPAQEIDTEIVDALRNFLFGPPGSGGFDLPSLNMQRGRDHGLPSYNDLREVMGRPRAVAFADITSDTTTQERLASVYHNVDQVDSWPGMLAEDHRSGALVGETMYRVLRDQFIRLRDGDRFWYQGYLPPPMVQLVEQQTLSVIIKRNTEIGDELQANVFLWEPDCMADVNGDGALTPADFSAWIAAYNDHAFWGDQNRDGRWTPTDFTAWIHRYNIGCE